MKGRQCYQGLIPYYPVTIFQHWKPLPFKRQTQTKTQTKTQGQSDTLLSPSKSPNTRIAHLQEQKIDGPQKSANHYSEKVQKRIVSILKITRLSFFFFINLGRQKGSEIAVDNQKRKRFCCFALFHPGQYAILAGRQVGSLFGWSKNKHNTSHH